MAGCRARIVETARVERFAEWLWRRWRTQFRRAQVTTIVALAAVIYGLSSGQVYSGYFGVGWGVRMAATVAAVLVVMLIASSTLHAPQWAAVRAWSQGDRSDPRAVLEASFEIRRLTARRILLWVLPVLLVTTVPYFTYLLDLSAAGMVALAVNNIGAALTGAPVFGAIVDLLHRPLRAEASVALGGDTAAVLPTPASAAMRIAAIGMAIAFGIGVAAAAVVPWFDTVESRYLAGTVAVLGFLIVWGPTFFYALAVVPTVRPIRDLTSAARRIGAGDYTRPLAVTSDDDLGALSLAVNDMQRGLAERERLRAAFGSYVDPSLAQRLLDQGDEVFSGERIDVTVLFVDIRDFTPFAESNTAEDTVARLNAIFGIVVPVVVANGGHVNKFLGDGALAVFGAPNLLDDHAPRALAAAVDMQCQIHERFGDEPRIGIGINTGTVIAGTIGGGGKLEFTLIGDTVNVAARVEQLTKVTGDQILLTQQTADALVAHPGGFEHRGAHELKGKSALVTVYGLNPA